MFRLLRFLVSLAMFLAFLWFAATVRLGKRTLIGHLYAIFGTQEARDLADGTKQEAEKVARRVRQELRATDMSPGPRRVRAPLDPVDDGERRKLDELVKRKTR